MLSGNNMKPKVLARGRCNSYTFGILQKYSHTEHLLDPNHATSRRREIYKLGYSLPARHRHIRVAKFCQQSYKRDAQVTPNVFGLGFRGAVLGTKFVWCRTTSFIRARVSSTTNLGTTMPPPISEKCGLRCRDDKG